MRVPAVEVEVGEQEDDEAGGEGDFRAGAPYSLVCRSNADQLAEKAEVDADIAKHRPGERGRCRKHRCALDHEKDRQEHRKQAGNAEHDAAVEREGVDRVLVGVGFPEIDLRQLGVVSSATKVMTAPGLSVMRNTSASSLGCRSSAKPSLGVMAMMRCEPRSGQNSFEFTRRKWGATITRSSCSSETLASAKTAQSP